MLPLVFLPGAGGSASFWQPVAERLSDLGPIHLISYPGFPGYGNLPADASLVSLDDLVDWVAERLPPGPSHIVAQSMGGVVAVRLALDRPERVARLVLVATSGGVDVARLGGADWRAEYRVSLPNVPSWFVEDRTDLSHRLAEIRAKTLLLWSDADPVSPLDVGNYLAARIQGARLVIVAGGTHGFANERPDGVAAAIRSHLA